MNEAKVYQLSLAPKDRYLRWQTHLETVYRWCDKCGLSYNSHPSDSEMKREPPRHFGECPLCYREKNPPRKRERTRRASGQFASLLEGRITSNTPIEGTITTVTVQVGGETR
jgi:hypothetical protein